MAKILAIDDDAGTLLALRLVIERCGLGFRSAENGAAGLAALRSEHPDVVLCDIVLPDTSGIEVLRQVQEFDPDVPVVMITGADSSDAAIASNVGGSFDYLPKPLSVQIVTDVVTRAVAAATAARARAVVAVPSAASSTPLIGRSAAMQELYRAIGRVANQRTPVLLVGESGTGKSLVARAIHQHSNRAAAPFEAVDCTTFAEDTLAGLLESASGGTIFLDDVERLPPAIQYRIVDGIDRSEVGDCRLLAATNRDLAWLVEAGRFRVDLFEKLSPGTLRVPVLRERVDDLEALVSYFLHRLAGELSVPLEGMTRAALSRLKAYPWPGNLRELEAALRRAIPRNDGPVLGDECFDFESLVQGTSDLAAFVEERIAAASTTLYDDWLARTEPEFLRTVLDRHQWNLTRTADALGINRMTLRARIKRYGLAPGG